MPAVNQTPELGLIFKEIERRLRAIETAPMLALASMQRGVIIIYNDAGIDVFQVGRNPISGAYQIISFDAAGRSITSIGDLSGAGNYGFRLKDATSESRDVLRFDSTGWALPFWPITMMPSPFGGGTYQAGVASICTSSGTFTELYRADADTVGASLSWQIVRSLGAATTLDWRIRCAETPSGVMTTVVSGTGVGTGSDSGTTTIPSASFNAGTGTDPRGRHMSFRLEVRVASGAGNVYAAPASTWSNQS